MALWRIFITVFNKMFNNKFIMIMRKKVSLLLLAALTSMPFVSVSAQQEGVFPTFRSIASDTPDSEEVHRVSPNADKEKGVLMYATTLSDYFNQERGWYSFRSLAPGNATKLYTWAPGSQSYVDGLRCGSWGGDNYYAFYVLQYSLGYDQPYAFVKVDVETGHYEAIRTFSSGDEFFDNWSKYRLYCMTYNPVKDVIYALGQTTSADNSQYSSLYKVNKVNGSIERIHDFDYISFGMAVDMDGVLWVQKSIYEDKTSNVGTNLVAMNTDSFEVIKNVNIVYDEKNFVTDYYGTMSFDYTTGDLYWIASSVSTYNQQLFKVDLEKGTMVSSGVMWGDFVGLYIPYILPENPAAPAKVAGLKAVPDMTGALKSTLTWVNPELQWNKEPLSDLTNVLVYRKGTEEPVATLDASANIGKEMSWTDENAAGGINTYYVVPCNAAGHGIKDSINVFVGNDAPGMVANVKIENLGEKVVLSWDAPSNGLNEGYLNPEGLKYTVVRYPDQLVVAKEIAETTVTDENFSTQQYYYYTVQASNELGVGDTVSSDVFMAGSAYTVPFELNFADELYSQAWANLGDWSWSAGVSAGDERMITSVADRADNWLISPDIKLEAGKSYKISSTVRMEYGPNGTTSNFKLAIGKGRTADAMTQVVRNEEYYSTSEYYHAETLEDFVEVSETDVYNFGVEVSKITGGDTFSFIGLKIEEVFDFDLAAIEVKDINDAIFNTDNTCKVVVNNYGAKKAENYKVKIMRVAGEGEYVTLGETMEVPAIEAFGSAEVTVTYKPDLENDMDIVGAVEIAGDANAANDMTQPYAIVVLPEGMVPFNRIITDENTLDEYTRAPMSFLVEESKSQTIYLADEINVENDARIQRIAYEYKGNDITSVLGPVTVKVYMCATDKNVYASETDAISIDEMKQVYEGEVTINPGTNLMSFILSEEYEYKKGDNLCVAVVKNGLVGNNFPALFKAFTTDFEVTRTIVEDGTPIAVWYVPVLQLAVLEKGGIEHNVTVEAPTVWYDSNSSALKFNAGDFSEIYVYDLSGKMVGAYAVDKTVSTQVVDLASGVYVVHAVTVEGKAENVKISVIK